MAGAQTPIDLSVIESLDEEGLDKLAAQLGLGDDDEDTTVVPVDGTPAPKVEDGAPQPAPKVVEQGQPRLTGQDLLKEFQENPEAQKLVQSQLNEWLKQASAQADAKKEQDKFQKLVEDGDYEAIGKRYVEAEAEKVITSKAEEAALTKAYGEVYGSLFKELEQHQLTEEEKSGIAPEKFQTDAEYVLALSNFIAQKKSGNSIDQLVDKKVEEKLTTLKNMKSATVANGNSPSALPGGLGGTAAGGKESSRSLIAEGFREILETAAENRIMEQ